MAKNTTITIFLSLLCLALIFYLKAEKKTIKQSIEQSLQSNESKITLRGMVLNKFKFKEQQEIMTADKAELLTTTNILFANGLEQQIFNIHSTNKESFLKAKWAYLSFQDNILKNENSNNTLKKIDFKGDVLLKKNNFRIYSSDAEYNVIDEIITGKNFAKIEFANNSNMQGNSGFYFDLKENYIQMFNGVFGTIP